MYVSWLGGIQCLPYVSSRKWTFCVQKFKYVRNFRKPPSTPQKAYFLKILPLGDPLATNRVNSRQIWLSLKWWVILSTSFFFLNKGRLFDYNTFIHCWHDKKMIYNSNHTSFLLWIIVEGLLYPAVHNGTSFTDNPSS